LTLGNEKGKGENRKEWEQGGGKKEVRKDEKGIKEEGKRRKASSNGNRVHFIYKLITGSLILL